MINKKSLSKTRAGSGIYCLMFPQFYPGAPIRALYWGKASLDRRHEGNPSDKARDPSARCLTSLVPFHTRY
jgi:hypothetical protein